MRSLRRDIGTLVLCLFSSSVLADASEKLTAAAGFFSINAVTGTNSASISNPSAFSLGYLRSITDQLEFRINYSILLADFTGSDMGYGLNVGVNYYPFTSTADQQLVSQEIEVSASETWRPYTGMVFAQRNFQSIRNSYAGIGLVGGTERYLDRNLNLYGEVSYISMTGSNLSSATEMQLVFGVVVKL